MQRQKHTIAVELELELVYCAACGIPFGITGDCQERRREDHQGFYCPNGHSNVYSGQTEAERLRQELEKTERELSNARMEAGRAWNLYDEEITAHKETRKTLGTTRRQLTNTKKRVAHGTCPVCRRHFEPLAAHMQSEHPDFVTTANAEAALSQEEQP